MKPKGLYAMRHALCPPLFPSSVGASSCLRYLRDREVAPTGRGRGVGCFLKREGSAILLIPHMKGIEETTEPVAVSLKKPLWALQRYDKAYWGQGGLG